MHYKFGGAALENYGDSAFNELPHTENTVPAERSRRGD
jgi:hypothetical protein